MLHCHHRKIMKSNRSFFNQICKFQTMINSSKLTLCCPMTRVLTHLLNEGKTSSILHTHARPWTWAVVLIPDMILMLMLMLKDPSQFTSKFWGSVEGPFVRPSGVEVPPTFLLLIHATSPIMNKQKNEWGASVLTDIQLQCAVCLLLRGQAAKLGAQLRTLFTEATSFLRLFCICATSFELLPPPLFIK